MSTVNNFFKNAADAAANAADSLKQRATGAYQSLRGAASRGADFIADSVGNATGTAPSADESFVRNAQNAQAAGLERGPSGLRSTAASTAARAADPVGGVGPTEGQMLKSAANYTPKGLSGLAARAGRIAGPASAIPEAYGAYKNVTGGENPLKSVGRAALRTGGAMLGGAAGAAGGTLLAPGVGTAVGGVAGGVAGYQAADKLATGLFGKEPGDQPAQVAMNTGADGATPQPATLRTPDSTSPAADNNYVDLTSGDRARPAVLTDTNFGVPASGQGAFRRTTAGNEGVAQPLGSNRTDAGYNNPSPVMGGQRDSAGRPAPAGASSGTQVAAGSNGLREVPQIQGKGLYANKASIRNAQLQSESRGQDATLASNLIQRQIQLAQLNHTLGNENEKRVNDQIDEFAKTRLPQLESGYVRNADKGAYDSQVAKKSAEIKSRFQYSIADRKDGRTVQQLQPAELQQLKDLEKVRDGVTNARSGTFQTLRDFFGQKRFDSENLYSYAPTGAETSAQGGYLVHFGNGNTAHVKEVAGGKFVLFGANDPVDADTMKLIRPAIEAAKRKG